MPELKGLLESAKRKIGGLMGDFPQGFNAGAVAGLAGYPGDIAYMLDTAGRAVTGQETMPAAQDFPGTTDYLAAKAGYPIPQSFSGQLGAAVGGLLSPGPGDLARLAPVLSAIPILPAMKFYEEGGAPVRLFHGGVNPDLYGSKPTGIKRGGMGEVYLSTEPDLASQYALIGGPDARYSPEDTVDVASVSSKTKNRNSVVYPVYLRGESINADNIDGADVIAALGEDNVLLAIADDTDLRVRLDEFNADNGTDFTLSEWFADGNLDLADYIDSKSDLAEFIADDGNSLVDAPAALQWLAMAGKVEEYADAKKATSIHYADAENGGRTFVIFDKKAMAPAFGPADAKPFDEFAALRANKPKPYKEATGQQ